MKQAVLRQRPQQQQQHQQAYDTAVELQDKGLAAHRSCDYSTALSHFTDAVAELEAEEMTPRASALRFKLKLASAATHLKLADYCAAETACTDVLRAASSSTLSTAQKQTAYYRRALARQHLAASATAATDGVSSASTAKSSQWVKAYRDAYVASKLSTPATAAACTKALALAESIAVQGVLSSEAQSAAQAKAAAVTAVTARAVTSSNPFGSFMSGSESGQSPGSLLDAFGQFGGASSSGSSGAGSSSAMASMLSSMMGGQGGGAGGGANPLLGIAIVMFSVCSHIQTQLCVCSIDETCICVYS
jgi:hypothetical protein